jgi:hypothetical protein
MPAGWVDTATEETAWKKAKGIVRSQRKKNEDDFSDRDWGLVTHIAQSILKSSFVSPRRPVDEKMVYALARVEHILEARKKKAKKGQDDDLPEDSRVIVEALKKVMGSGGQSIALLRQADSSGMKMEEAQLLANELTAVAEKLKALLDSMK